MVREKFWQLIKGGADKLSGVFFLISDDYYVLKLAREEVLKLKRAGKGGNGEVPVFVYYGSEIEAKKLSSAIAQGNLFSSNRVIVISEANKIKVQVWREILKIIEGGLPSSLTIIFEYFVEDGNFPSTSIMEVIDSKGIIAELTSPSYRAFNVWLQLIMSISGINIKPALIPVLIHLYGENVEKIITEVKKLMEWRGGSPPVSERDIISFLEKEKEYNFFELYYALSIKNMALFLECSKGMIFVRDSEAALLYLSHLYTFFTSLLQFKEGKQPRQYLKRFMELSASRYPISLIYRILNEIMQTDMVIKGVKRSNLSPEEQAYFLAIKICGFCLEGVGVIKKQKEG